ncbi:hypothetical protein THIOM_002259, partial [Candidatus Thiomargarita nelsonii]
HIISFNRNVARCFDFDIAANQEIFQQTLSRLVPVKQHPMYEMENRVDSSHQGFFNWVNLEKILPLFQLAIPPQVASNWQKWGLLNSRAVALGWGATEGKGRFSIMIDAPIAGYREFFPPISNNLSITASGKPGTVISLSIPVREWFKAFEKFAQTNVDQKKLEEYKTVKEEMKKEMGFSLEEALSTFGPEILFFTDEVGGFVAVKIGNEELVSKILTILVDKYKLDYKTRQINGKTYHYLVKPAELRLSEFSPEELLVLRVFVQFSFSNFFNSHFYWVEDEGYLIFAGL